MDTSVQVKLQTPFSHVNVTKTVEEENVINLITKITWPQCREYHVKGRQRIGWCVVDCTNITTRPQYPNLGAPRTHRLEPTSKKLVSALEVLGNKCNIQNETFTRFKIAYKYLHT